MIEITTEKEVQVTSNKVQKEEGNPYLEILKKKKNPLYKKSIDYFLKDHTARIQELGKDPKNIRYLEQYLEVLTELEQNPEVKPDFEKQWNKTPFFYTLGTRTASLFINTLFGTSRMHMYQYKSRVLPWCCGISEYGDFFFAEFTKINRDLLYNIMLDLIKLSANSDRNKHSGAVGIINYFTENTNGFIEQLEQRDDLTFIKEFENPKTKHKLKMFVFNTLI